MKGVIVGLSCLITGADSDNFIYCLSKITDVFEYKISVQIFDADIWSLCVYTANNDDMSRNNYLSVSVLSILDFLI